MAQNLIKSVLGSQDLPFVINDENLAKILINTKIKQALNLLLPCDYLEIKGGKLIYYSRVVENNKVVFKESEMSSSTGFNNLFNYSYGPTIATRLANSSYRGILKTLTVYENKVKNLNLNINVTFNTLRVLFQDDEILFLLKMLSLISKEDFLVYLNHNKRNKDYQPVLDKCSIVSRYLAAYPYDTEVKRKSMKKDAFISLLFKVESDTPEYKGKIISGLSNNYLIPLFGELFSEEHKDDGINGYNLSDNVTFSSLSKFRLSDYGNENISSFFQILIYKEYSKIDQVILMGGYKPYYDEKYKDQSFSKLIKSTIIEKNEEVKEGFKPKEKQPKAKEQGQPNKDVPKEKEDDDKVKFKNSNKPFRKLNNVFFLSNDNKTLIIESNEQGIINEGININELRLVKELRFNGNVFKMEECEFIINNNKYKIVNSNDKFYIIFTLWLLSNLNKWANINGKLCPIKTFYRTFFIMYEINFPLSNQLINGIITNWLSINEKLVENPNENLFKTWELEDLKNYIFNKFFIQNKITDSFKPIMEALKEEKEKEKYKEEDLPKEEVSESENENNYYDDMSDGESYDSDVDTDNINIYTQEDWIDAINIIFTKLRLEGDKDISTLVNYLSNRTSKDFKELNFDYNQLSGKIMLLLSTIIYHNNEIYQIAESFIKIEKVLESFIGITDTHYTIEEKDDIDFLSTFFIIKDQKVKKDSKEEKAYKDINETFSHIFSSIIQRGSSVKEKKKGILPRQIYGYNNDNYKRDFIPANGGWDDYQDSTVPILLNPITYEGAGKSRSSYLACLLVRSYPKMVKEYLPPVEVDFELHDSNQVIYGVDKKVGTPLTEEDYIQLQKQVYIKKLEQNIPNLVNILEDDNLIKNINTLALHQVISGVPMALNYTFLNAQIVTLTNTLARTCYEIIDSVFGYTSEFDQNSLNVMKINLSNHGQDFIRAIKSRIANSQVFNYMIKNPDYLRNTDMLIGKEGLLKIVNTLGDRRTHPMHGEKRHLDYVTYYYYILINMYHPIIFLRSLIKEHIVLLRLLSSHSIKIEDISFDQYEPYIEESILTDNNYAYYSQGRVFSNKIKDIKLTDTPFDCYCHDFNSFFKYTINYIIKFRMAIGNLNNRSLEAKEYLSCLLNKLYGGDLLVNSCFLLYLHSGRYGDIEKQEEVKQISNSTCKEIMIRNGLSISDELKEYLNIEENENQKTEIENKIKDDTTPMILKRLNYETKLNQSNTDIIWSSNDIINSFSTNKNKILDTTRLPSMLHLPFIKGKAIQFEYSMDLLDVVNVIGLLMADISIETKTKGKYEAPREFKEKYENFSVKLNIFDYTNEVMPKTIKVDLLKAPIEQFCFAIDHDGSIVTNTPWNAYILKQTFNITNTISIYANFTKQLYFREYQKQLIINGRLVRFEQLTDAKKNSLIKSISNLLMGKPVDSKEAEENYNAISNGFSSNMKYRNENIMKILNNPQIRSLSNSIIRKLILNNVDKDSAEVNERINDYLDGEFIILKNKLDANTLSTVKNNILNRYLGLKVNNITAEEIKWTEDEIEKINELSLLYSDFKGNSSQRLFEKDEKDDDEDDLIYELMELNYTDDELTLNTKELLKITINKLNDIFDTVTNSINTLEKLKVRDAILGSIPRKIKRKEQLYEQIRKKVILGIEETFKKRNDEELKTADNLEELLSEIKEYEVKDIIDATKEFDKNIEGSNYEEKLDSMDLKKLRKILENLKKKEK